MSTTQKQTSKIFFSKDSFINKWHQPSLSIKQSLLKFVFFTILAVTIHSYAPIAQSAITNPAINESIGTYTDEIQDGTTFAKYFVMFWNTIITLGGVLALLYFIWGGIDWITAGGDSGKIQQARMKIVQAFIGMFILAFSFIIIAAIDGVVFGNSFSILNLKFGFID